MARNILYALGAGLFLFVGYIAFSTYRQVTERALPVFYIPYVVGERIYHVGCVFERITTQISEVRGWYYPAGSLSDIACVDTELQREYAAFMVEMDEAPAYVHADQDTDILRTVIEGDDEPTYIVRAERKAGRITLVVKTGFVPGRSKPTKPVQVLNTEIRSDQWEELRSLLSEEALPVLPYIGVDYIRAPDIGSIVSESLINGRHRAFRRTYLLWRRQDGKFGEFLDGVIGCRFTADGNWRCWRWPVR